MGDGHENPTTEEVLARALDALLREFLRLHPKSTDLPEVINARAALALMEDRS